MDDEQRKNLEKLADYLLNGEIEMAFDMSTYCSAPDLDEEYSPFEHEYGSVACAIGHGPAAGIPIRGSDNSWLVYAKRVFGVNANGDVYHYLFHPDWADVDNTAEGAGHRIKYFLEHGVPDGFDDINTYKHLDQFEEKWWKNAV